MNAQSTTIAKKYELVEESAIEIGMIAGSPIGMHTLYRIRALRDFKRKDGWSVKAGDIGGYIEFDGQLSHDGACWIDDDAQVMSSFVRDHAIVAGNAKVELSIIDGDAKIGGDQDIFGARLNMGVFN